MSTMIARVRRDAQANPARPSDSGVFVAPMGRSGHGAEDAHASGPGLVRGGIDPRIGSDPYEARAAEILEKALASAGATKADLARALGKSDVWAGKLCKSGGLRHADELRLRDRLPSVAKMVRAIMDRVGERAPIHAGAIPEQHKVLVRWFGTLLLAEGQDAWRALNQCRAALDGYEALLSREGVEP